MVLSASFLIGLFVGVGSALDIVDAIVFFQVMCPKVKRIAEIDDYAKADPIVAKELAKIYKEEIYSPWYSEVTKELYSYGDAATGNPDAETKGQNLFV